MTELTKDYLDKKFEKLVTKDGLEAILDRRFEEQAQMIARGFENMATKSDIVRLEKRIDELDRKIDAISEKLDRHLEISDKHYLELKRRDAVIAKWINQIAEKTGVKIDLTELDKF